MHNIVPIAAGLSIFFLSMGSYLLKNNYYPKLRLSPDVIFIINFLTLPFLVSGRRYAGS